MALETPAATPPATPPATPTKVSVAATIIHIGEPGKFKVFAKGEEVKGITDAQMKYLKDIGEVKEVDNA